MQVGVLLVTILLISVSELICRYLAIRKSKTDKKVLLPQPVIMLILSIFLLSIVLNRGGETYFFLFYDTYKMLFQ
jgi:hypothetical protein